ncbi:hypothetical protein PLESTF_000885800 [Pleodorina starrii]|nr:hypothetical protein PLESTM_001046400 [Pleodorina starrii]GLC69835.1 hypothetical protein PLESTF_000885800 [Pleodorina starrii]
MQTTTYMSDAPPVLPSPSPVAPGTPFPADRRFEDCYAVCRWQNPGIDPYLVYCDKNGNRYDNLCWALCSYAEAPFECPADTAGGSAAAAESLPAASLSDSTQQPQPSVSRRMLFVLLCVFLHLKARMQMTDDDGILSKHIQLIASSPPPRLQPGEANGVPLDAAATAGATGGGK